MSPHCAHRQRPLPDPQFLSCFPSVAGFFDPQMKPGHILILHPPVREICRRDRPHHAPKVDGPRFPQVVPGYSLMP